MKFFSKKKWTAEDIPELEDRKIIVTGANSGLGFEATRRFAEKEAEVTMACRSMERGSEAKRKIEEEFPNASLELRKLDLSSLESVKDFAEEYSANHEELHILCNNAGIMAIPRQETEDSFEKQFGVNHLGHFALTARLFPLLEENDGETRVVTQSSGLHEKGEIDFEDLMMEETYDKWRAYAQSKLANVLFAYELDRKISEKDLDVKSVVCHPGYAATNLQYRGPKESGSKIKHGVMKIANTFLAQSAEKGALPMLYAATSEKIEGGEYIGPGGLGNMRGYPVEQESSPESYNKDVAEALWNRSEGLTGEEFEF